MPLAATVTGAPAIILILVILIVLVAGVRALFRASKGGVKNAIDKDKLKRRGGPGAGV